MKKVKSLILYPVLVLVVTGCVAKQPPTQEIADAETALEAAKEADALRYAPDEYNSAEEMLAQARAEIEEERYTEAKASAISARQLAEIARDSALRNKMVVEKEADLPKGEGAPKLGEAGFTEEILVGATGTGALGEGVTISQLSIIHFNFDEYILTEGAREVLNENAAWMRKYPGIKVKIEGHCDERGTVEYNLALGQKRAESTKNYLVILGIDPDRLSTVSYGEEVPVEPGHNEQAWAKNRRAEFVILK